MKHECPRCGYDHCYAMSSTEKVDSFKNKIVNVVYHCKRCNRKFGRRFEYMNEQDEDEELSRFIGDADPPSLTGEITGDDPPFAETKMEFEKAGTFNVFNDVVYARLSPLDLEYIEKLIKADLEQCCDINKIRNYIKTFNYFKDTREEYIVRRNKTK